MVHVPSDARALARTAQRVVVLTGAGMSAESGLATFRAPDTGLWSRYRPEALASAEAFAADPALVWGWYCWRAGLVRAARPNAGHHALASWARRADVRIVTQNVDDLHERAGSSVLSHLHGSLLDFRCLAGHPYDLGRSELPPEALERVDPPRCPRCRALVRPGVVWFGENLPDGALESAADAVRASDLLVVVGTSGAVYPAARLPGLASQHGVPVIEINPEPTDLSPYADISWRTTAALGIPALVAALDREQDADVTRVR